MCAGCSFSWIKQPRRWTACVPPRWWSRWSCPCLFILYFILHCSCVCKPYFLSPWHILLCFINSKGRNCFTTQWTQSLYQRGWTLDVKFLRAFLLQLFNSHIFLLLSLLLRWIKSHSRWRMENAVVRMVRGAAAWMISGGSPKWWIGMWQTKGCCWAARELGACMSLTQL